MILYFKTTNNRVEINTINKTIKTGYSAKISGFYLNIKNYELRHIIEEAKNNGYVEV